MLPGGEIIVRADPAGRPFGVGCADAPVAVVGAADEEITASAGKARAPGRAERQFLSVALGGDSGAGAQGQTALVPLGDDVDDAGDRVGPIDRRGADGANFDPVDEIARARRQADRSEELRVGKECVSSDRYRWAP